MSVFVFVPIGLRESVLPTLCELRAVDGGQLLAVEPRPERDDLLLVEVVFYLVGQDLVLGLVLHVLRPGFDLQVFLLCFVFVSDVLIGLSFIFGLICFY